MQTVELEQPMYDVNPDHKKRVVPVFYSHGKDIFSELSKAYMSHHENPESIVRAYKAFPEDEQIENHLRKLDKDDEHFARLLLLRIKNIRKALLDEFLQQNTAGSSIALDKAKSETSKVIQSVLVFLVIAYKFITASDLDEAEKHIETCEELLDLSPVKTFTEFGFLDHELKRRKKDESLKPAESYYDYQKSHTAQRIERWKLLKNRGYLLRKQQEQQNEHGEEEPLVHSIEAPRLEKEQPSSEIVGEEKGINQAADTKIENAADVDQAAITPLDPEVSHPDVKVDASLGSGTSTSLSTEPEIEKHHDEEISNRIDPSKNPAPKQRQPKVTAKVESKPQKLKAKSHDVRKSIKKEPQNPVTRKRPLIKKQILRSPIPDPKACQEFTLKNSLSVQIHDSDVMSKGKATEKEEEAFVDVKIFEDSESSNLNAVESTENEAAPKNAIEIQSIQPAIHFDTITRKPTTISGFSWKRQGAPVPHAVGLTMVKTESKVGPLLFDDEDNASVSRPTPLITSVKASKKKRLFPVTKKKTDGSDSKARELEKAKEARINVRFIPSVPPPQIV